MWTDDKAFICVHGLYLCLGGAGDIKEAAEPEDPNPEEAAGDITDEWVGDIKEAAEPEDPNLEGGAGDIKVPSSSKSTGLYKPAKLSCGLANKSSSES